MFEPLKAEPNAKALMDALRHKKFTAEDIEMLADSRGDGVIRRFFRSIFKVLIELGRQAVPSLMGVLKDKNSSVHRAITRALQTLHKVK